jgi:hypothetical protein
MLSLKIKSPDPLNNSQVNRPPLTLPKNWTDRRAASAENLVAQLPTLPLQPISGAGLRLLQKRDDPARVVIKSVPPPRLAPGGLYGYVGEAELRTVLGGVPLGWQTHQATKPS